MDAREADARAAALAGDWASAGTLVIMLRFFACGRWGSALIQRSGAPKVREPEASDSIALKAFAALESVVNAAHAMSLDEITQALGLPKPTVFRILSMLNGAELLRREPASKRYTVGPRLTAFAVDLWRNAALRVQWHRALQAAVDETGEACNLTLLEGNEVLYLDRVETTHRLRLHLEPGTRVPLHCSASGKLFLSQMPPEKAQRLLGEEPYKAYTEKTITTFAELEAELRKVRKTMVGTHDSELFEDSVAIAVPVTDRNGNVFAAVASHAPASRLSLRGLSRFLPALRRAAEVISSTMCARPETVAPRAAAAQRRSSMGKQGPRSLKEKSPAVRPESPPKPSRRSR